MSIRFARPCFITWKKKRTFGDSGPESDGIILKLLQNDSPETGDEVKKNPVKKYFFIMEKNDFENFDFQKKSKILIFSIEKSIF